MKKSLIFGVVAVIALLAAGNAKADQKAIAVRHGNHVDLVRNGRGHGQHGGHGHHGGYGHHGHHHHGHNYRLYPPVYRSPYDYRYGYDGRYYNNYHGYGPANGIGFSSPGISVFFGF